VYVDVVKECSLRVTRSSTIGDKMVTGESVDVSEILFRLTHTCCSSAIYGIAATASKSNYNGPIPVDETSMKLLPTSPAGQS